MPSPWADRTTEEAKPHILLVDDQNYLFLPLTDQLEERGFEVTQMLKTPQNTQDIIRYALNPANRVDAVLTDLYEHSSDSQNYPLGYPYAREITAGLRTKGYNGPIIVHSGVPEADMETLLKKDGADGLYSKLNFSGVADALHQQLQVRSKLR